MCTIAASSFSGSPLAVTNRTNVPALGAAARSMIISSARLTVDQQHGALVAWCRTKRLEGARLEVVDRCVDLVRRCLDSGCAKKHSSAPHRKTIGLEPDGRDRPCRKSAYDRS